MFFYDYLVDEFRCEKNKIFFYFCYINLVLVFYIIELEGNLMLVMIGIYICFLFWLSLCFVVLEVSKYRIVFCGFIS